MSGLVFACIAQTKSEIIYSLLFHFFLLLLLLLLLYEQHCQKGEFLYYFLFLILNAYILYDY